MLTLKTKFDLKKSKILKNFDHGSFKTQILMLNNPNFDLTIQNFNVNKPNFDLRIENVAKL